jgi:parvulin-like peptidyl-prolyl isomerase
MYKSAGANVPDNPAAFDDASWWLNPYPVEGMPEIQTYGDYVKKQADDTVKRMLAMVAYCKENKLELSKEDLKNVDAVMNEILEGYKRSKTQLNTVLFRFNINYDILKEIKKYEALAGLMGKHLFDSSTGKRKITADMINALYQQECVRVKHILIAYPAKTYDVNGDLEPYPEEAIAAMQVKIDDIYGRIKGGEDFDNLFSEYEDFIGADGYTFSTQTTFMPQEVIKAAYEMKTGDFRKVESDYGTHIIKKFALLPVDQALDIEESQSRGAAVMWSSSMTKLIQAYITNEELKKYIEKIEVNTAETDLFDIMTSELMFDCFEITQ